MSETWFTSDIHFGHRRVLQFEPVNRPFQSLEDMNVTIIHNWNKLIGPADLVYVLGDFAFNREGLRLAKVLHGRKKLILGNHDIFSTADYLEYFDSLHGALFLNRVLALTHIPIHPNEFGYRSGVNVHGHLHGKLVTKGPYQDPDERYFNACLEQNNMKPFHMDEVMKRAQQVKQRHIHETNENPLIQNREDH